MESNKNTETIELVQAKQFFEEHNIQHIDLMKVNIEGGEYDVLERLIQTQRIKNVRSVLVQFHKFPCGYETRYQEVILELSKTHTLAWDYKMVWALWVKNS